MAAYKEDWDRLADQAYTDPAETNGFDPELYDSEYDYLIDNQLYEEAYDCAAAEGEESVRKRVTSAMKFIRNDPDFRTAAEAIEFIKRRMFFSLYTEQKTKEDMIIEKKLLVEVK